MNLYRLYGLIFFFLNLTVFGQNPEDKIYNVIDAFWDLEVLKLFRRDTQRPYRD
ncbi:hypothetical protein [Flavobacterium chungangense]|uniref:hypothetical protein n=1 Tax=Flavobacterium chungangense TaxID=554283 RepID=UPI000B16C998|nr:hypothetical protein [Flavobacterium chungangense]